MLDAPRQGLGSFFRALLDFVDERGVRARVRELVSAETRELIDKPPRPLAFIASTPIDEIETALQKLLGNAALVDCGVACARPLGWTMLQPVLRIAFQLLGQSPEPIFSNLERFFSLVTRGIHFAWEGQDQGGMVLARFEGPDTPQAAFHVLRGTLLFVYEVTCTQGEVGPPELIESAAEGCAVRYAIRWK